MGRRLLTARDLATSATLAFLGFVVCLVLVYVLPDTFYREPAVRGGTSSGYASSANQSGMNGMGAKLHRATGDGAGKYDVARRSFDESSSNRVKMQRVPIPLWPVRIAFGIAAIALLGLSTTRLIQWVVILRPQRDPAEDLPEVLG